MKRMLYFERRFLYFVRRDLVWTHISLLRTNNNGITQKVRKSTAVFRQPLLGVQSTGFKVRS